MFKKSLVLSLVFAGALSISTVAFASLYEWFDGGTMYNLATGAASAQPGGSALGVLPGDTLRLKYRMSTNAPYEENRSVYIVSTTSTGDVYEEIPACRRTGTVNLSWDGSCDVTYSILSGNSYKIRVTTNFAGCGSFTPTPTAYCGDALDFPVTLR